ncbi:MAG: hypothetical protein ABII97_01915 [Patescibacteria group bacterium]
MSILDKITGFFGVRNEDEDNVGDTTPMADDTEVAIPAEPTEEEAPVINPEPEVPAEETPITPTPEMSEDGDTEGGSSEGVVS